MQVCRFSLLILYLLSSHNLPPFLVHTVMSYEAPSIHKSPYDIVWFPPVSSVPFSCDVCCLLPGSQNLYVLHLLHIRFSTPSLYKSICCTLPFSMCLINTDSVLPPFLYPGSNSSGHTSEPFIYTYYHYR